MKKHVLDARVDPLLDPALDLVDRPASMYSHGRSSEMTASIRARCSAITSLRMIGGLEDGRSLVHLAELFVLADQAGLLRDPELAGQRIRQVMALAGVAGS